MSARASGSIRRVVVLTLVALAGCGGDGPTEPGPKPEPEPVLTAVEIVAGADQVGSVGLPLDLAVQLRAVYDTGDPAPGVALTFAASGDGSVDPGSATTDASGMATVAWTMATAPGPNELEVTPAEEDTAFAMVTATGFADTPAGMELLDGDGQSELAGVTLPAPIRVRVVDRFDNPVVGVPVEFSAAAGTVAPAADTTDLDGVAAATWTLGSGVGAQAAQALVRDSAVFDIVDLPGSPVAFTASAVGFALDSVSPAPATVGDTLRLTGTGFAPTALGNEVRIDGQPATIVGGTQTAVMVTIPGFGCVPTRSREVVITRDTHADTATVTVDPVGALDLAVGERTILTDPSSYCLSLLPGSSADSVELLVGLTATRAWNASASFMVTASDTSAVLLGDAAAMGVSAPTVRTAEVSSPDPELALRRWERTHLTGALRAAAFRDVTTNAEPTPGPASVGDGLTFRVPDITTDPCNDYVSQPATVVYEGPRLVVAVPQVPSLILSSLVTGLQSTLSTLDTLFSGTIYPQVTAYTGSLDAADADGRVTVLLTTALDPATVPVAFGTAVDLTPRATCPASDEQMVAYVAIPSLDYTQLSTAISTVLGALQNARPELAHELTHVAQNVIRLGAGLTAPLPAWLAEGQAELMVEVIGRTLRGDAPRMDYGADVVNADAIATTWYRPRFDRLSYFFGWDGGSGQVDGAPEQCSLFGFGGLTSPCDPAHAPGAAWSFVRFLTDRIAPDFTDGEPGVSRALLLLADDTAIDEFLQSNAGTGVAGLMVDWAATLYTDGRLDASVAPDLQLAGWDLADIYDALPSAQRLQPETVGFDVFERSGSVVGGGTAYLRLRAAGDHAAVALRYRDALGRPLSADLGTRLWVVRVR